MDTPATRLVTPAAELLVVSARLATPLSAGEQDCVRAILQGRIQEVQAMPDRQGNQAVVFKSTGARGTWQVLLFVDAQSRPVCLKAWGPAHSLELRWPHPADANWVDYALQLREDQHYQSTVRRFVQALGAEGGLQELLREPGDGPQGTQDGQEQEAGLLEPATQQCLHAVVLSMAGREDEVGQRVCEALERAGASPATLHLLDRARLAAVLAQPGLRPDVSDLRWWPPACVGRLIDRLFASKTDRASARTFLGAVYRGSEPAGSGNVWPEDFSGGLQRSRGAPHAPQLWFGRAMYFAHTDVPVYRTWANTLLRRLENAYSVADRPRTLQDVANLADEDLRRLGVSRTGIRDFRGANGLLGWLKAAGRLQALQKDFAEGVTPARAKPMSAVLNIVLHRDDLPQTPALREAVEAARRCLQARCRGRGEAGPAGDRTIDLNTAGRRLRAYSRFWRLAEDKPLQDLLQGSQAHGQAFERLPRPERAQAQAVFARDRQQRQDVMEHLFALPMRAQALLVEFAAQAAGIDMSILRPALNTVHPDRLRLLGYDTPADYHSTLHGHAGLAALAASGTDEDSLGVLGTNAQNQLRRSLRRSDEEWQPGRPTLLQQALLLPERWRPEGGQRTLDAAGAGVAHLGQRVEFKVADIKPALQRLREQVEAAPMMGETRYWPEVAANVQWQQQVDQRLMQQAVPQPAAQRALSTLGQWMRHHERKMAYNPFNNHVALALRRQPSAQAFLQSVRHDLSDLAQRLRQSLAEEQQFWQEGLASGKFEPLGDGSRIEEDLLQEQLQHLGSPDEPAVALAFHALYELAGPSQAADAQAPGQQELSDAQDEAPAGPGGDQMEFDPSAWGDHALVNLDMQIWPDWIYDHPLPPAQDGSSANF